MSDPTTINWQPIDSHPLGEETCLLAQFSENGLEIADRGGWTPGEHYEEWDEVEEGVKIKIYEEDEEGQWWTNHCLDFEPTHWAELSPTPNGRTAKV